MKTGRKSKSEKGKEEEKRRERSLPGREKKGREGERKFPSFFLSYFQKYTSTKEILHVSKNGQS